MSPTQPNPDLERAMLRRAAVAAMRLREQESRDRFAAHPWPFFLERAMLLDPLAPSGSQVAPYPDFDYTRALVSEVHDSLQLIIWKARRMIASWTIVLYFVWRAAHLQNQRLYLITRVEGENDGEGARELIARAAWALNNLREGPRIRFTSSKLQITFPDTGSTITGMGGNEPNKMRQMAATAAFCDEFPFWDKPEEAYRALRPTMEGRGKVIIASSTAGGYFKQLVYDEADSWMSKNAVPGPRPVTADAVTKYVEGMEAWTNRGNGFRVIALDYWADPRKQPGSEWEAAERKGRTKRDWDQEMLRKFNISSGRAVMEHEWDPKRMVVPASELDPFRPLICALDFGYNRPALTVSTFLGARVWRVLRAHLGHKIHFTPFMNQVMVLLAEWFPEHSKFHWCCDAAGKHEGHDSESEVTILRKKYGIKPRFRYSLIPPTIDRMRDYMTDVARGMPAFQVERHPSTRIVIDALNGGWAYPEAKPGKPEPDTPDKDGFFEHVMDTLRYTVLNFGGRVGPVVDLAEVGARDILPPRDYTLR